MRKRTILGLGVALAGAGLALYRKRSTTPLTDRVAEVTPTGDSLPDAVGAATTDAPPVDREDVPADVLEDEIAHGVDEASQALVDEDDGNGASGEQSTGGSAGETENAGGNGDGAADASENGEETASGGESGGG